MRMRPSDALSIICASLFAPVPSPGKLVGQAVTMRQSNRSWAIAGAAKPGASAVPARPSAPAPFRNRRRSRRLVMAISLGVGRAALVVALPGSLDERLEGAEAVLVGHLLAPRDPVAEIEIGQAEFLRPLDQPQHHVGAEAAPALPPVEELVDGG